MVPLLWVFVGIPWCVAQEVAPSFDSRVKEMREFLKGGKPGEALPMLRALTEARPGRKDLVFLKGLVALQYSRRRNVPGADREALLDEAIAAFRTMLIDQPSLLRVRLELARAFFYKGEDALSQEHFERVLAGNPAAPVVANVRQFLHRIRARRRWNMHLVLALAPDTNIGGTSDERIIYIFGLPFRRDAKQLTTSGIGLAVWGGGEYQHPLGNRVRLRMGVNASRREYSDGRFDRMLVSSHVGPRVFVGRATEFSILGNWRHQWSANEPRYFDLGGRMTLKHRFTRRLTGTGRAAWNDRRYRTSKALDGAVRNFALGAGWVLTPTIRVDAEAGHGRDRPDGVRFRNKSWWLHTGVSVALPKGFTVGVDGGIRWTEYEAPWFPNTLVDENREDRTYHLRTSVRNRALTFFGFSPEVSLIHEVRKTNAQLYGYKRTGGELRVVRQF